MSCREGDLQIYNISDVDNITQIATLDIENEIVIHMSLGKDRIFLNGSSSAFFCADISNPYSPELLYEQDISDLVYDMCWQNDRLYLAGYDGLDIYDVSDSLSASQLNNYRVSLISLGVAVLDSTILITGWNSLIRLKHEIITAIDSEDNNIGLPQNYYLSQNYPNPFNGSTLILFNIPTQDDYQVIIYNVLGRKVRTLFEGTLPAGRYELNWDGTDDNDGVLGSGIYFYSLKGGGIQETKKIVLLK